MDKYIKQQHIVSTVKSSSYYLLFIVSVIGTNYKECLNDFLFNWCFEMMCWKISNDKTDVQDYR
jgi:hypothetical protein